MNRNLPVAELVVLLIVGLASLAVRTWWGSGRARRRWPGDVQRQRSEENRETERQRVRLIAGCVLIVLISLPLILKLVPPNGSYGFRIRETRSNPAVWYAANAFMGWALSIAAAISATALFTLPTSVKRWLIWLVFLAPVVVAVVASFVYVDRLTN